MERFTPENSIVLLIDHQQGTVKLAKNIPESVIIRNTRALLRTAKETNMPLVLTTSNETNFQGPLFGFFESIVPEAFEKRIKRQGIVNTWDDLNFREAVKKTGRKKLIMAGLTNDVCIVFAAISAVKDGYDVQVVVDAGGSPTTISDETALRRMENEGVVLTGTNQIMAELAYDWSSENGSKIITVMYEEVLADLLHGN